MSQSCVHLLYTVHHPHVLTLNWPLLNTQNLHLSVFVEKKKQSKLRQVYDTSRLSENIYFCHADFSDAAIWMEEIARCSFYAFFLHLLSYFIVPTK